METRLLRYFTTVVAAGTVSAAAQQLHITQPSLSRQLRQLEHSLGLALFHRGHGRLQLTTEGREFYTTAQDLLQHHHEVAEYAAQLAQGRMPRISLGAPNTTLTDVVAPFVATFQPADPVPSVSELSIDLEVTSALSEFDMVVAPVRWPDSVATLHLMDLPVWAYVPAEHPWAEYDAVPLTWLAEETLILPTGGFKARRVLEAALEEAGLQSEAVLETKHSEVAHALAAARRGAAILTDDPRYDLRPVRILHQEAPLQIRLFAAWRARHHAAGTLEALARRLREFCRARYAQAQ
ncbi:LysR family transcriptional regulator [Nesterenkonia ebinurensis]|uniref:LysR family transcriptional regulator n=1 Tax=Nesterenkonia ebinurensis TaxID=2608252 RepID=UPI00123D4D00|nr:LysR family transcriptional regulator [Nesterenkonia ebinurensis]